ncbi:MAG: hypothetical protein COA33_005900 [Fluviicola sp.]|nr:hypothetical protein [Fluviicola sp.]
MRFSKENEKGKLLFWIDITMEKIDLSKYSGVEGDYGNQWTYTIAEVPKELCEDITKLGSKLNVDGEPITQEDLEKVINEAMNQIVSSQRANSYFLN